MSKFLLLFFLSTPAWSLSTFTEAKKHLRQVHRDNPLTLYCGCRYQGKTVDLESCGYRVQKNPRKARRLEWEHVVPAHAFGHSFVEWREGDSRCVKRKRKFKGRKCAKKNPLFARMEGDLYNLYPELGELNQLRSNYSMAELGSPETLKGAKTFGKCGAIVHERKFEPMDRAKGVVARIYQYMDQQYPGRGIISEKNRKLFEAWDKLFPVTRDECERGKRIEALQGNPNPILEKACVTYFSSERTAR